MTIETGGRVLRKPPVGQPRRRGIAQPRADGKRSGVIYVLIPSISACRLIVNILVGKQVVGCALLPYRPTHALDGEAIAIGFGKTTDDHEERSVDPHCFSEAEESVLSRCPIDLRSQQRGNTKRFSRHAILIHGIHRQGDFGALCRHVDRAEAHCHAVDISRLHRVMERLSKLLHPQPVSATIIAIPRQRDGLQPFHLFTGNIPHEIGITSLDDIVEAQCFIHPVDISLKTYVINTFLGIHHRRLLFLHDFRSGAWQFPSPPRGRYRERTEMHLRVQR